MEKQRILFVCVGNAIRSQMAEAFTKQLGGHKVEAYSAGVMPPKTIDPKTIEVMKELDMDLSKARPKGFLDLIQQEFDYVINLEPTRDEIKSLVENFLKSIL